MKPSEDTGKTEEHDLLHLWLSREANQMEILRRGIKEPPGRNEEEKQGYVFVRNPITNQRWAFRYNEEFPLNSPTYYAKQIIEKSPQELSGCVYAGMSHCSVTKLDWFIKPVKVQVEHPLFRGRNGSVVAIIDCLIEYEVWWKKRVFYDEETNWIDDYDERILQQEHVSFYRYPPPKYTKHLLCELKPKLNRISQTLGQINTYRQRVGDISACVLLTFDQDKTYDKLLNEQGIQVYRVTKEQCLTEPLLPPGNEHEKKEK
jgi:hypothetical protein